MINLAALAGAFPPNKAADWAFISHMIETAKPRKGRIAVITPHGVLCSVVMLKKRIRRAVIEENILDAVIGIPSNLFQTTSIPVVILIFDLKRQRWRGLKKSLDDILFIDASSRLYLREKRRIIFPKNMERKYLTLIGIELK